MFGKRSLPPPPSAEVSSLSRATISCFSASMAERRLSNEGMGELFATAEERSLPPPLPARARRIPTVPSPPTVNRFSLSQKKSFGAAHPPPGAPPPAPPPPPPAAPLERDGVHRFQQQQQQQRLYYSVASSTIAPLMDRTKGRGDLLVSIRSGAALKKVEKKVSQ